MTNPKPNTEAQNEADKNADTQCLGKKSYLFPTPELFQP